MATQQAADDPSPTLSGRFETNSISSPRLQPRSERTILAHSHKGAKIVFASLVPFWTLNLESSSEPTSPRSELIVILAVLFTCTLTLTRLLIAAKIAGLLYITKCSPNKTTFPGAEALAELRLNLM